MVAARTVRVGGLVGAAALATLAAELAWVVHRPLPSLVGMDASGRAGPSSPEPIRLVVLGDSTTTGPGLASAEQIWLRRALHRLEPASGVEVRSLAVGGSRVGDVLRRLPDVWPHEPDAVVVAVGSNDAIHGTPAWRFGQDLDRLVGALHERVGAVAVCNVGDLGNLARVPVPLASLLSARSRAISRRIERVVAAHDGVVLVDVTAADAGFRRGAVFAADLFHPNELGHDLWAAAAVPGLAQLLLEVDRRRAEAAECAQGGEPTPTAAG
ncbi:MAG: GDSL-type esterase/lipase family protein [Acidimicrobiales bacterium]